MILRFEKEKETKNTIRFKEISDEQAIGVLYVQKYALEALGYEPGDMLEMSLKRG